MRSVNSFQKYCYQQMERYRYSSLLRIPFACYDEGILELMKDKAEGVIIRILMKEDGPLNNLVETIFSQLPNVQVLQSISINAKVVTMIIDRHKILSIEIADSSQHDILNTVGLAPIQTADPLYNPPTQYLKCSGYRQKCNTRK
ncbi:MAG TPA: hypothetical protein VE504_07435 [Nitrososphaeraceae archaeon]|nr:hypothetical protein [Nitrososphaeraceae archaeon]